MPTYHFISGLPRSGSTLLAGILRQNPQFHAGITSPIAPLMQSILEQTGAGSEFQNFFDERMRKRILMGLFQSFYQDELDSQKIIFDTNRIWNARLHQLVELFDDFKVICCVRNPAWIADSFENIYRKNPFDYSRMFNQQSRMTVYSRCESMFAVNGVIGSAWTALKEAFYGDHSDRLLLLDYNLLTSKPEQCLDLIYQFLDLPGFQHDFGNVNYTEQEFDSNLGVKNLHSVKPKVEFKARQTILPPDLFKQYDKMDFWSDTAGTNANIIAQKTNLPI